MKQQNNANGAPNQKPKGRFWHVWGPIIIKLGIAYLVTAALAAVLMIIYFASEGAVSKAEMQVMLQSENIQVELYNFLMEKSVKYMIYTDGIASIFTIPILLIMFYRDKAKEKVLGVIQNKKAPIWQYVYVIVIAATMCLGLNNLIVLSGFAPMDESYTEVMELLYSAPMYVQIVCLGILAPICEELVFRGLMFKRLRALVSFRYAAIYTSMVFAFIHGNMVQLVYAFIMGLVFAYLYEKYGSFKAPVIAHIVANLISVLLTELNSFEWLLEDSIRIAIVTIACAAIASSMYVLIARIEEKPELPDNMENDEEPAVG